MIFLFKVQIYEYDSFINSLLQRSFCGSIDKLCTVNVRTIPLFTNTCISCRSKLSLIIGVCYYDEIVGIQHTNSLSQSGFKYATLPSWQIALLTIYLL